MEQCSPLLATGKGLREPNEACLIGMPRGWAWPWLSTVPLLVGRRFQGGLFRGWLLQMHSDGRVQRHCQILAKAEHTD